MATNTVNQPTKKAKACILCHSRKVRCDVSIVGIPCTRCVNSTRGESCSIAPPLPRGPKRKAFNGHFQGAGPGHAQRPRPSSVTSGGPEEHSQAMHPISGTTGLCSPDTVGQDRAGSLAECRSRQTRQSHVESEAASPHSPKSAQADDSQLHQCRELSQWAINNASPTRIGRVTEGREFLEYHEGLNPVTILSEVFSTQRPKRLARIILEHDSPTSAPLPSSPPLEENVSEFLRQKGAFNLPSRPVSDKLLRIFFECVHPYTPFLDKIEFLEDYEKGTCSIFLMQSIFASMVSYATADLIREAGYSSHLSAQQSFFEKAQLLCDLGAETSQLRLLQGSIALSLLHFSFATYKDYRYWLSNAIRIATSIGLHKSNTTNDLEATTRRTFRRLWWILYYRDALIVSIGLDNIRRIHDDDFDATELTDDDLPTETIPMQFSHITKPTSSVHRLVFMANCTLSRLNVHFIAIAKAKSPDDSKSACDKFHSALSSWRRALPEDIRADSVDNFDIDNFLILVLLARSHMLSCIAYRTVLGRSRTQNKKLVETTAHNLNRVTFELGTVLDRIMIHNVVQYCPLFLAQCASTLLALLIETALKTDSSEQKIFSIRIRIDSLMKTLQRFEESWGNLKWTLRLFQVVLSRTGLLLTSSTEAPAYDIQSMNPFHSNYKTSGNDSCGMADQLEENDFNQVFSGQTIFRHPSPVPDPFSSVVIGQPTEDWVTELFNTNIDELSESIIGTQTNQHSNSFFQL